MQPKIYVETSIISYLTAWPSRDIVTAARQQITRDWWQHERDKFDLYISEFVINEASRGDSQAAALRIEVIKELPQVELDERAATLAESLIQQGPLPQKAALDALHVAVAVSSGIDYLLTWNFKHLANATMRTQIDQLCRSSGYEPCVICTPEELQE